MAADVGGLIADIGLNVGGLRQDIKQANNELRKGTNRMNRSLGGLQKKVGSITRSFRGLVGVIGLAFGVRAAGGFVKGQIDMADQMLKLTQRIGGSTEALSEYQFVAERANIEFNTMTMGLQRMTRRISEAAGGMGEARGALAELGLDAQRLESLSLDQQFETIADALSGVPGEADRTRLAMRLFDSEGVSLLQTMTNGAAGIRELRAEAKRLGVTIDQETAEKAAEFNDRMVSLKASATALGRSLVFDLIPALDATAMAFAKIFNKPLDPFPFEGQITAIENRLKNMFLSQGQRSALLAELEELKKKQEEALGVGFGGVVSLSPPTGANGANVLSAGQTDGTTLPNLIAEFEALENEAEASARTADEAWSRALQNIIAEFEVLEDQRNAAKEAADAEWSRTLENLIIEFEFLEQQRKDAEDAVESMAEKWAQFGDTLGRTLKDTLADFFLGIETNFGDMLKRMAARAAASGLFNAIASSATGGFSNFLGFLGFGGPRADGGPVSAGKSYLVGERGPELFIPGQSGMVAANAGGGNIQVNNYVTVEGGGPNIEEVVKRAMRETSDVTVARVGDLLHRRWRR